MIKLRQLSKTFIKDGNRIDVLKGLDLEIQKGESLAVVGVSGSGKSTLIHILGTLDHPTSGVLLFEEKNVFEWPEKKLAAFRNERIGFVFQFHNLLPEFSSLENTMMPALIHGLSKSEARKRAEAILNDLGLRDRMTHKPGELSGGEQQRVAVARALINDPDILLCDEPTGNLDSKTGAGIMDLMTELNRKGTTIIMVTHDAHIAEYSRRTVRIADGRIVA